MSAGVQTATNKVTVLRVLFFHSRHFGLVIVGKAQVLPITLRLINKVY